MTFNFIDTDTRAPYSHYNAHLGNRAGLHLYAIEHIVEGRCGGLVIETRVYATNRMQAYRLAVRAGIVPITTNMIG